MTEVFAYVLLLGVFAFVLAVWTWWLIEDTKNPEAEVWK